MFSNSKLQVLFYFTFLRTFIAHILLLLYGFMEHSLCTGSLLLQFDFLFSVVFFSFVSHRLQSVSVCTSTVII